MLDRDALIKLRRGCASALSVVHRLRLLAWCHNALLLLMHCDIQAGEQVLRAHSPVAAVLLLLLFSELHESGWYKLTAPETADIAAGCWQQQLTQRLAVCSDCGRQGGASKQR